MYASKPSSLKEDSAVLALQPEAQKISAFSQSLVIASNDGYTQAADTLKSIKGLLQQIETKRKAYTDPLLKLQRLINKDAKELSAPLQAAERKIKAAMVAYSDLQEQRRLEEQRKADEAARRAQEKLQQRAEKAAASGKFDKAADLEAQASGVVAPVIQREAPKVSGIASREVWKFEITDASALPREYTMPDEKKIGAVVRALKGDTNIPGVRVWREKTIASSAA